jgi:hypothetical protein
MEKKNVDQLAELCENIYSQFSNSGVPAYEALRCLCVIMARFMYEGSNGNKDMRIHKKALLTLHTFILISLETIVKENR